jgi:hypothetical protein
MEKSKFHENERAILYFLIQLGHTMKKKNPKARAIRPISKKIIAGLRKASSRKVVDISELRDAKIHAEELEKTVIEVKELAELDPLHGVYTYAQNKISVMVEQLGELPAMSKLVNAYADAQDEYMPSGPPLSPLTNSYFSCWGFFDLCAGIKKETFGTVIIDMCKYLNVDAGLIKIFEHMQNSRMGLYVHEGVSGKFTKLRELITEKEIEAIVPSGYVGRPGEMLLARIMPEPFPELNYGYSVLFTTPYVLSEMQNGRFVLANEDKWLSFFARAQERTKINDKKRSYEILMKYGLNRHYWNEYIFEGYVNYQTEMILLAGFPDIALSRPHSRENSERF